MSDLVIGQKLWFVTSTNRSRWGANDYYVSISKIGRKWVYVKHTEGGYDKGRIGIDDLRMDGGDYTSPGECYISKESYEKEKHRNVVWERILNSIRYSACPKNMSIEKLNEFAELLGVDLTEKETP